MGSCPAPRTVFWDSCWMREMFRRHIRKRVPNHDSKRVSLAHNVRIGRHSLALRRSRSDTFVRRCRARQHPAGGLWMPFHGTTLPERMNHRWSSSKHRSRPLRTPRCSKGQRAGRVQGPASRAVESLRSALEGRAVLRPCKRSGRSAKIGTPSGVERVVWACACSFLISKKSCTRCQARRHPTSSASSLFHMASILGGSVHIPSPRRAKPAGAPTQERRPNKKHPW